MERRAFTTVDAAEGSPRPATATRTMRLLSPEYDLAAAGVAVPA